MKRMFLMMAIAIATTLQVPAQESKTKLTAQQRTEQRIKEMDEKLTLSDEQKTKIRELYADFNKQKYPREKRREALEKTDGGHLPSADSRTANGLQADDRTVNR